MIPLLQKFSDQTYALLRIFSGLLFACHGFQKVFGMLGGEARPLMSLPGAAGIIELIGGILILVGFSTSWVAFICSGQMAVAYFISHASRAFWPIQNRGELAVLYCLIFLYFAAKGSGIWSLDGVFGKKDT